MPSESKEIRRLLRQVYIVRLTLLISLLVAIGSTAIVIFESTLVQPAIYGPASAGVAQSTIATPTATAATTAFSSTVSSSGGYVAVAGPLTPNPQNSFALTALVSWAVFGAALIWRGRVRSVWGKSRFSYDTFRLLVKMRGAQTRLNLMHTLNSPKNKLQLATALGIDWKAVDRHVQVLEKNGLIQATSTSGTTTFYEVTQKGKDLIQVLEQLNTESL